ncbi:hypothetical protein BDB00DRAFT_787767 [Zychaea mexicana]|uniref:uncharacterized protein n=1 Tax=Zychaea mexicana TaxID=64656 RepID=UPI0022FEFD3A|nr:uncharacterized protein BDB00DRAFT_787767 [Zychaea mexicana]KAI9493659.1 hypothetical protein BDB00DRAFT_787767 [Zychaea mexicana]
MDTCGAQRQEKMPLDKHIISIPQPVESNNGQSSQSSERSPSRSSSHPCTLASPPESGSEDEEPFDIVKELLHRRYANMPPDALPPDDRDESDDEHTVTTDHDSSEKPGFEKQVSTTAVANQREQKYVYTKYACLRNTPLEPFHNRRLVFLLLLLEDKRRLIDLVDTRALAYRRAACAIKAYPKSLESAAEAMRIPGIGPKVGQLIAIYLETGTIPEAEDLLSDEKFRTLKHFCKAFHVGPSTANRWWDNGYRTFQDVLDRGRPNESIKLGIQLLPEFEQPMNRQDVEELIEIIILAITDLDEGALATPVGGYRRGTKQCNDLDIVISWTDPTKHQDKSFLRNIMEYLEERGYLKHRLLVSDKFTKYHGRLLTTRGADLAGLDTCFCAFLQPSKQMLRQVDLVVATPDEYGAAVLAWTGSRHFERDLRLYAKKEKYFTVSGHRIFDAKTQKPLMIKTEEDAFEALGIPYIEPTMRNC